MSGRRVIDKTKLLQKRGTGTGKEYKPWFFVSEVSSRGQKNRVLGTKTGRIHTCLSELERDYCYILDFSDKVIDIREQFPLLPLSKTVKIAKDLGLRHGSDNSGNPLIMSTDFLITLNSGEIVARTLKYQSELNEKANSIMPKFRIEEEYYKELGINWQIVREIDFDRVKARNIGACYGFKDLRYQGEIFKEYASYKNHVLEMYNRLMESNNKPLKNLLSNYEKDTNLDQGIAINIIKHMLFHKMITIDMRSFIKLGKNLEIISCVPSLENYMNERIQPEYDANKRMFSLCE